jgi:GNAT superfamily N-acetyltransferase
MGWFGPMGTHPDLRGLGIGSILLKRCLKDMKRNGLSKDHYSLGCSRLRFMRIMQVQKSIVYFGALRRN